MDTDNVVGAAAGLLALGIVANVAGKMMSNVPKPKKVAMKKQKVSNTLKSNKFKW